MATPSPASPDPGNDTGLESRLERLAEAQGRPSASLKREAAEQYLDREEKREQFRQDTLAAWAEYQATGLHLTQAEVDAWLAKLEAGEEAEPPVPHR